MTQATAATVDRTAADTQASTPLTGIAVGLTTTALAACGGGGGGSSSNDGSDGPPGQPTAALASRFLLQAGFAVTDDDIARVQLLGYETWLTQTFGVDMSESNWAWLMAQGYQNETYKYSSSPADYAIWHRLITAQDQLRQRVALALSEYFVVSTTGVPSPWPQFAMAAYWDLLCTHAFGNFRQLLEAITLNPAMGYYLSTRGNRKEDTATGRAPDENYAREVMQLFTIGLYELNLDGTAKTDGNGKPLETYSQDTITNLARVFTGWDLDTSTSSTSVPAPLGLPMTLTASRHSTLAVNFLGTTIPAGTDGNAALKTALDTLFNHPNVGPFFGRQMIQRLVTSNPSPQYVARVASAFNNDGQGKRGELRAVVRAVLLDPEARAETALSSPSHGRLREPMLRFVQWARTFQASSALGTWKIYDLSDPASRLAQSPLRSPSVFNYYRPGYTPPNTALAAAKLVAPEFQIANEPTVAGYLNFMQSVIANGIVYNSDTKANDVTANYSTELSLAGNASALVKRLNLRLAANQLSATTEASIIAAVESIATSAQTGPLNRVRAAILLVMASPEYLILK